MMHSTTRAAFASVVTGLLLTILPDIGLAKDKHTRSNPACVDPGGEAVFYNPSKGQDILLPKGYKIEVFAKDLNFPTAIAFKGDKKNFTVYVLESGKGLPGACNDNEFPGFGGKFSAKNPFTPDILVFNDKGKKIGGPIGKPTATGGGFQPDGPAIGLAFENVFNGGILFATDSNQGVRGAVAARDSSRVVTVDLGAKTVNPFIVGLPTGDHPTEQILARNGFIYWSQGSATNSAVVGHDNGGGAGANQHEIACQTIQLSANTFWSGDTDHTSGYSIHGLARPFAIIPPFEDAKKPGMCTGAILRARIHVTDPSATIQPVSWGYRNPFGIRFPPAGHVLGDCLFITENGEDERGARPTNNAPDRLQCGKMRADGSPDWHGWPDSFGGRDSQDPFFNPIGGPADDLCGPPLMPVFNQAQCTANVTAFATPVKHVLNGPPFGQTAVGPLGLEPADVAAVGPDFVPDSFTSNIVRRGAALVSREGDFGFSLRTETPIQGHDVELVNFVLRGGQGVISDQSRFARNCRKKFQSHTPDGRPVCKSIADQDTGEAFAAMLRGINRPVTIMFGPDEAAYLVDYGAVRDFGRSDPAQMFKNAGDAPLAQIPGTGVIWKITRHDGHDNDKDDKDDNDDEDDD
jgi:glucose/arabinose dehydrogenase